MAETTIQERTNQEEGQTKMIVAGEYYFKNGKEYLLKHYPDELMEVYGAITAVDAAQYKTKISDEKTMIGKVLYSPVDLNVALKQKLAALNWSNKRVRCDYPVKYYTRDYQPRIKVIRNAFRDMDFVKNKVGVEVQFGKYAFAVYNVCAKMTIFKNLGHINAGIEIVPVKDLVDDMSSGIIYFEQFVWDLEQRGEADIDIPVLIIGVAA